MSLLFLGFFLALACGDLDAPGQLDASQPLLLLGKNCTADGQCGSRFCVDGHCCNRSVCANPCQSCTTGVRRQSRSDKGRLKLRDGFCQRLPKQPGSLSFCSSLLIA